MRCLAYLSPAATASFLQCSNLSEGGSASCAQAGTSFDPAQSGIEGRRGMVRRARRLALSRGLGHADVRDAAGGRPRGSSSENRGNLAPAFFDQIIRKYEGTRLGGCSDPFRSDTAAVPRVIPSCYRTPEFDRQTFS
jgi:hypothetical protein